MFLQATVDARDADTARKTLQRFKAIKDIDYVEIGAPLLTHYGVDVVKLFQQNTELMLYADTKTIDFPEMELRPYIKAGITRMSAMAIMNDGAFKELAQLTKSNNLTMFVSLMGYPIDRVRQRVKELLELGFDTFIAHGAGVTTADAFNNMMQYVVALTALQGQYKALQIVAAGGINAGHAQPLAAYKLAGVIVGRGLGIGEKAALNIKAAIGPSVMPTSTIPPAIKV